MFLCQTYADVRRIFQHSSQFAVNCSGAEALEAMFRSAVDDTSNIVRDDLIADCQADLVSLPNVADSI